MDKEKDLIDLVGRLRQAAGANLRALVLYGSAVDHDVREHSDLNVLCLLHRLEGADLESLRVVGLWWWRKGHPPPLLFTLAELLIASASSFDTLFRHALIALGQEAPKSVREAADRLAKLVALNAAPFHRVLDLREGKSAGGELNLEAVLKSYLDLVTRVAEEIDRRLAS